MKRVLKKLFKEKFSVTFGLIIGAIIMGGISYGIDSISSSGVSYTKDGKVMSVKQAIDDLIVKVNGKGSCGLFSITLREQNISVSESTTTSWLKSFIDETLNTMFASIDNLKEVNTDELKKLKNGEYTWSSSDTNIVVIDGTTVTPNKTGNVNVIATTDGGASVTIPLVISDSLYLADVVAVGDYVAYDAGTWASSANRPTNQGQFGGYTKGQNKANSVSWCYNSSYTTTLKGWRVFSVDTSTKTVTLVHAGEPECYYHSGSTSESAINLNNRATSEYLNSDYASSAHMVNKGEADQNILRMTGDFYWLATAYDATSFLKCVSASGDLSGNHYGSYGVRPVVVLKSNILTTGKGTDMVGQVAWKLVKP